MKLKKKVVLRAAGILGTAILIFTFFSNTIYGLTLPSVRAEPVASALVPQSARVSGTLTRKASVEIKAGTGWRIDKVYAKNDERVRAGDILFTIETRELEMRKMQYDLELLQLQNRIDSLGDSAKISSPDTLVAPPFDGHLLDAGNVRAGQSIAKGTPLGRYVDDSAFLIDFPFHIAYKGQIKPGMAATVSLPDWMTAVEGQVTAVPNTDYMLGESRVFTVTVRIVNPGSLTENAAAAVEIVSAEGETLLAVGAGALRYAREELLTAPGSGMVTETSLTNGARYSAGERLLRVEEEAVAPDLRAAQRSRAELLAQLAILQMQAEQYAYPADGAVMAEEDGVLFGVNVREGDTPASGATLLSIAAEDDPIQVEFFLPKDEGELFRKDATLRISFASRTEQGKQESTAKDPRSVLTEQGDAWKFTVSLTDYTGIPALEVEAEVNLSKAEEAYELVVPASSIRRGLNGESVMVVQQRRGLFGDEYYVVEKVVKILDQNAYLCAVEPGALEFSDRVVTYTSRALTSGEIVSMDAP